MILVTLINGRHRERENLGLKRCYDDPSFEDADISFVLRCL